MKILDPKTGQLIEASEGELVNVIDPSGVSGTLPSEQVASALQNGFRLENPKSTAPIKETPVEGGKNINSTFFPNTLFNKDNVEVKLPFDKIPEALVSGEVNYRKDSLINVIDPSGVSGTLPGEEVASALQNGFRLESPDEVGIRQHVAENKGIGSGIKVALGQLADEGLMGIPETIMDHTQTPYERAQREALKKEWKVANAVGGGIGAIGSLFLGGPLFKGANILGRTVERGILGVAERGAEELAVEGASKVAGNLVLEGSEKLATDGVKALTVKGADKEATAVVKSGLEAFEKATIERVENKLIENGASKADAAANAPGLARKMIAATARGGVEGGIIAAPQAITETMLGDPSAAAESLLYGIGGGAALGITGALGKQFIKLTKDSLKSLPDAMPLVREVIGEKINPEGMRLSAIGAKKSDFNKFGVDKLTESAKVMGEKGVFDFGKSVFNLKEYPTFNKIFKRLEEVKKTSGTKIGEIFSTLDESISQNPYLKTDALTTTKVIDKLKNLLEDGELNLFIKDKAGNLVNNPVKKSTNKQLEEWLERLIIPGEDPLTFKDAMKLKNDIRKETRWDTSPSAIRDENILKQKIYWAVSDTLDEAVEGVGKRIGNDSLLNEYLILKKDYSASTNLLDVVDNTLKSKYGNRIFGLTDFVQTGPLGAAGIATSFATGNFLPLLTPVLGLGVKKAIESSVAHSLAAKTLEKGGLLFTEQAMKKVASKIDEIPSIMSSTTKNALPVYGLVRFAGKGNEDKSKLEQFNIVKEKLTALQLNPQETGNKIARLGSTISNGAPKISEEYIGQQMKLYQFLYDKLPHNTKDTPYFRKGVSYKPNDMEIDKFSRILATVDDPFRVINDIMSGSVTADQVEVLRTIYPSIYAAMISKINDLAYSEKSAPQLTYQQRLKLSLFMGYNFDPSLDQTNKLQNNFAPAQSNKGQGAKIDLVTPKNNPLMTGVQSLANRK